MATRNSHNIPDWLKTNKPQHQPTIHEQNLRAENLRLKERVAQLEDALKVSAKWCDDYRQKVNLLTKMLKEGVGADE